MGSSPPSTSLMTLLICDFMEKKFNFIHHFRICLIMGYRNGWSWYLISYLFVEYESRFYLSLFIEYRSKILSISICWIWIQILFVFLFSIVLYLLILLLWAFIFSILTEFIVSLCLNLFALIPFLSNTDSFHTNIGIWYFD